MDLKNFFGYDVESAFLGWLHGEFTTRFRKRFGDEKGMTLVILDPDKALRAMMDWEVPLNYALLIAHIGDIEAAAAPGGTLANVEGKLRFCLRTVQDSVVAETAHGLRRVGDFPWEGAGFQETDDDRPEFIGGVSGLAKEEDWEMFVECASYLGDLMALVDAAAKTKYDLICKIKPVPADLKYMQDLAVSQEDVDKLIAEIEAFLNPPADEADSEEDLTLGNDT